MEQLYTVKEIASALKLNKQTIQRFIREEKIKAVKVGREYRVSKQSFEDYLSCPHPDTIGD